MSFWLFCMNKVNTTYEIASGIWLVATSQQLCHFQLNTLVGYPCHVLTPVIAFSELTHPFS